MFHTITKEIITKFVSKLIHMGLVNLSWILEKNGSHLNPESILNSKMGILQYQNKTRSGEKYFIEKVLPEVVSPDCVVFDVGANIGEYANEIHSTLRTSKLYCFEPNPVLEKKLVDRFQRFPDIHVLAIGVGEMSGELVLYDYADREGSEHASLYRDVLSLQHGATDIAEFRVPIVALDEFCKVHKISRIGLLKIDTEGHELAVLKGASNLISSGGIRSIHFEFNEMNVISRVFFKDFYDLLPGYKFYRMHESGLISLGQYSARLEIFKYQNILAINAHAIPNDFKKHVIRFE